MINLNKKIKNKIFSLAKKALKNADYFLGHLLYLLWKTWKKIKSFSMRKFLQNLKKKFSLQKTLHYSAIFLIFLIVFQFFFPVLPFLPTIPFSPNKKRTANANIQEAQANDNAMFVNVNPEFKVEFGDRSNTTLHRVRFEANPSSENPFTFEKTKQIKENLLSKVKEKVFPMEKGIEFSLISAEINGKVKFDQGEEKEQVFNNDGPLVDNEVNLEKQELGEEASVEEVQEQKSVEEVVLENMKRELKKNVTRMQSQISEGQVDSVSEELTKMITEAKEVYAKTELFSEDGKNIVKNPEVVDGVDIEYQVIEGEGVKEDIVIKKLDSYDPTCFQSAFQDGKIDIANVNCSMPKNSYIFNLKLDPGVEVHQAIGAVNNVPSGTYYFTDSNGRYLFHFLPPYAIDAKKQKTNNVKIEIVRNPDSQNKISKRMKELKYQMAEAGNLDFSKQGFLDLAKEIIGEKAEASEHKDSSFQELVNQPSEYLIKFTVDSNWLLNPVRSYPIRIDPSIVHDTEVEFDSGDSLSRVESISGPQVQIQNPNGGNDQYTKLLLHADGTNGETTFTDSSYVMSQRKIITTNGGAQITTAQSKFGGSSAYFDGNGDYLSIPANSDWNFDGDFTIDFWFRWNSISDQYLMTSYNGGWGVAFNAVSATRLYTAWQGTVLDITSGINFSSGTWYHLAAVRNNSTIKVYVDGVEKGSVSKSGNIGFSDVPLYIGTGGNSPGNYPFNGWMDEVRITKGIARWTGDFIPPVRAYDYQKNYAVYTSSAMDLESVTSIDSLQWTENGVQTGDGETPYSSTNLVAQWNFNETSGTSAADSSGNSHTGTLTNFASTGSQDAAVNSGWTANNRRWGTGGLTFDGSDDYVSVSDSDDWTWSGDFSVDFWVKFNNIGTTQVIINHANDGAFFRLMWVSSQWNIYIANSVGDYGYQTFSDSLLANVWYHVAITRTSGTVRVFRDGVQKGNDWTNSRIPNPDSGGVKIGVGYDGGSYFNGTLDSFRIYKGRALSAEEILSNYQAGNIEFRTRTGNTLTPNDGTWEDWKPDWTGTETQLDSKDNPYLYDTQDSRLVAYWPMNEISDNSCSGGTNDVCDKSGTNDGAATGTKIVDGKFGKARYFDGTDDYVSIPDNTDFEFGSGQFVISYWFKVDTPGTYYMLWKDDSSTSFSPYAFLLDPSGNMYLSMSSSGSSWDVAQSRNVATGIAAGRWNQVILTRDGGNNISTYINGILADQFSSSSSLYNNSNNLSFGKANHTSSYLLSGYLDEIRMVKGSSLSAQQAYHDYQKGLESGMVGNSIQQANGQTYVEGTGSEKIQTGVSQVDGNTVGLWNFEETGGSSAYIKDSAGTNHGTPSGTTVVDGISGKARSFNGSSDYISVPDSDNWNFGSGDFAIETWLNFSELTSGTWYGIMGQTAGLPVTDMNFGFYKYSDGNFEFDFRSGSNTYSITFSQSGFNINQWYHFVINRSSTTITIYVDGVSKGSVAVGTSSGNNSTQQLEIGSMVSSNSVRSFFKGLIDSTKIYKGRSLSVDEIANAYRMGRDARIGQTIGDEYVKLLIHANGTNASKSFIDSSVWKNTVTSSGDTQISTAQSKFGGSSAYFDGTTDYLSVADGDDFSFGTSDFTIDFWAYNWAGTNGTVLQLADGAYGPFVGYVWEGNLITSLTSASGSWNIASGVSMGAVPGANWVHYALVRNGSNFYTFRNGTQVSTFSSSASIYMPTGNVNIGRYRGTGGVNLSYGSGYVDELRVSKGIARWTSNFTPPSAEYFSGDFSSTSKIPFYVAADRIGSYLEATVGESNFANNEVDANTGGIWRLEEATGTGAYAKDSSGNNHDGTPTGTTFVEGKIGKGRYFDGTDDYISIPDFDDTGNSGQEISVFAWVNIPIAQTGKAIASHYNAVGDVEWIMVTSNLSSNDKLEVTLMNLAGTAYKAYYTDKVIADGKWHYVGFTFNAGTLKLYVDGAEANVTKWVDNTLTALGNATANILIGAAKPSAPEAYLNGIIDEVNISSNVRTASEIRQSYEIGKRTHKITIDFAASLDSDNLITDSDDLSFTIDATTKGLTSKGENLYKGDKIIVKENYNGTEYIAHGTVASITTSTGETAVASWDVNSTFPSSGFTASATVFKWQREYMDLTGAMDDQIDAANRMTLRITDGIEGRSIWLDDFESVSDYLTDSDATSNVVSTLNGYIQYQAIISTTDSMVTPYLSGVDVNYSSGPTLDLLMRHGKWFSGGVKKSFWWAK